MNKPNPFDTFREDFYKEISRNRSQTQVYPVGPSVPIVVSPEVIKRVGTRNPDVSRIICPPLSISIDH